MPELPEVETIVRSLRNKPGILGRRITSAQVLWARTIAVPELDEFTQRISGQTIVAVERRGKFIVIRLSADALLIHLRMSGDIRVESEVEPVQKHDRLLLNFGNCTRLAFNDTRKFGRVWLTPDITTVVGELGPEPFDFELTGDMLFSRLQRSSRCVKTLLLDQSVIAGVGNIYSDEALHRARLHPALSGKQVTLEQSKSLLAAIRETLTEGIARNGASIDWVYRGGDFQNHFRVYQRTGKPCPVCGTKIERRVIGQRSSHFCPHCQPL